MIAAREYIDAEFETVMGLGIKGAEPTMSQKAVLKMMFISGMSAALAFPGTDVELGPALKEALKAVSERYGGRTWFPFA